MINGFGSVLTRKQNLFSRKISSSFICLPGLSRSLDLKQTSMLDHDVAPLPNDRHLDIAIIVASNVLT